MQRHRQAAYSTATWSLPVPEVDKQISIGFENMEKITRGIV